MILELLNERVELDRIFFAGNSEAGKSSRSIRIWAKVNKTALSRSRKWKTSIFFLSLRVYSFAYFSQVDCGVKVIDTMQQKIINSNWLQSLTSKWTYHLQWSLVWLTNNHSAYNQLKEFSWQPINICSQNSNSRT